MKRISIFVGLMIVMVALAYYAWPTSPTSEQTKSGFNPYGIGTKADPEARLRYEVERFKNPETGMIPLGMRSKELTFAKGLPTKNQKTNDFNWVRRGPSNLGGRTRAMALDVTNENVIMAGGVTGGMWKSVNAGESFYKVTGQDQIQSVSCVVQDRRFGKSDIWYYGTGEGGYGVISAASFSNITGGNGIYKSTDGGESFEPLASTVTNTPAEFDDGIFDVVWKIVINHLSFGQDILYVAVAGGIMMSDDGGENWQTVLGLEDTNKSTYADLMITTNGVLYATLSADGSTSGLYRSVDGTNWTEITPAGWPGNHRRTIMAFNPCNENEIYFLSNTPNAGQNDHSFWHYTYLGGNGAGVGNAEWDNRSMNLPDGVCTGFYDFDFGPYSSQSSYDMCMGIKPDDCNTVIIGGTNLYRSENGFTTPESEWIGGYQCDEDMPSNYIWPNHHPDQHVLIFLPSNPNIVLSANDGGLYRTQDITSDAIEWESLNNGYVTTQFYTVAIEHGDTDSDVIVGGMQDNGTMFNNNLLEDSPWAQVFYGDGAFCAIPEGRQNYYLSWQTGKTFKFEIDENGNVNNLTRIDPDGVNDNNYQFINPFILDPTDNNVMYLSAGTELYRNDNLSEIEVVGEEYSTISTNWTHVEEASISSVLNSAAITALSMSTANPHTLYYGSSSGRVYRLNNATSDNPEKVNITGDNFPANAYVSSIALDDDGLDDAENIVVSLSNYGVQSMFYSSDGGNSWMAIGGNLEENPDGSGDGPSVTWVDIHSAEGTTTFFAGTTVGLYSTTSPDGANTVWEQEAPEVIGRSIINMITSRSFDNRVVIATHGNGVFSNDEVILDIEDLTNADAAFTLSPIFPNPVAGMMKVRYQLNQNANIKVSIYDMAGREIQQLYSGEQTTGSHKLKWNTGQLTSGTYLCVLSNGQQRFTQKFVKE